MSKSQLAKLDVPFGLTQPRINIVYNSAIQHRIVFLVLSGSVSWAYNDSILWRSRNKQAEKWKATNNLVVVATRKCWFIHGKLYIVFHCQLCLYSRLIYCIPYLCCNFHYLCHLFSLAFQQVVFLHLGYSDSHTNWKWLEKMMSLLRMVCTQPHTCIRL